MREQDFDPVADAFRNSLVYRVSHSLVERSAVAARESGVLNRIREMARSFTAQTARQQIQALALTIAIASLAHLAIRELLPRYATSGLPWWWNVAVAGFAMIIAILGGPIASASADSTPGKLWRRLTA